jgi:hypothetical protein
MQTGARAGHFFSSLALTGAHWRLQEDPSLTRTWKKTIKVAVTGASGQISNHLLFMVRIKAWVQGKPQWPLLQLSSPLQQLM